MPIDSGDAANKVFSKLSENKLMTQIVGNPIVTGLFVAFVIVIIILFTFRSVDFSEEKESLLKLSVRSGIYIFFVVTFIQFMQNRETKADFTKKHEKKKTAEVFEEKKTGGYVPSYAAVYNPVVEPSFL